jgi:hypothetical protein
MIGLPDFSNGALGSDVPIIVVAVTIHGSPGAWNDGAIRGRLPVVLHRSEWRRPRDR